MLPLRDEILQRLGELDAAGTVVRNVRRRGERYFYFKQAPGKNNPKLFVRDGLSGAERLLADADKYAAGGGQSSISAFNPSPDGKFVLLRLDYDAGHGIGSSRKQRNEETADVYAFLFAQLGGKK